MSSWKIVLLSSIVLAIGWTGYSKANAQTADEKIDAKPKPAKRMKDELSLKNGGILKGRLMKEAKDNGRAQIVWETPAGGYLKLDKSRAVRKVHKYDLIDQEYDRRVAKLDPNSPDQHWDIINWCEDTNRRSRFRKEIVFHARQIVRIDGNDDKAKAKAGYEQFDNVWILKEHKFTNHGYEEKTGGWVPQIFSEVIENEASIEQRQNDRNIEFRKWKRRIGKTSPNLLATELKSITDEFTIGKIYDWLLKERSFELRLIGVDAIGTVASEPAQRALIFFAIRDSHEAVRDLAQVLLKQDIYDRESIAREIAQNFMNVNSSTSLLRSDVRRAGHLLGELGSQSSIQPLIDALNTTHKIRNPDYVPKGGINPSMSNDGGAGLQMGGGPEFLTIKADNQSVLDSLRRITGLNYGFDESTWREWYTENFTADYPDIRRDE